MSADLGALVASPHFRFTAGMRISCFPHYGFKRVTDEDVAQGITYLGWLPDIDDPTGATKGCMLHLVREAWGDPGISTDRCMSARDNGVIVHVWIVVGPDAIGGDFPTEAEALVGALLAAPPKVPS